MYENQRTAVENKPERKDPCVVTSLERSSPTEKTMDDMSWSENSTMRITRDRNEPRKLRGRDF